MSSFQDVAFTYCCGLATTMGSAPLIHPFNVIAASAAKTQLTSGKAAHAVYVGLGSNQPNNVKNFWNGLMGHCAKELVRSWGRIGGVVYLEPHCKESFSPVLAPHVLATSMAAYEIVFANPADVWKSYRSTGIKTTVPDLFKGSLGNFWRQYGMWYVWSLTTPKINALLDSDAVKLGSTTTAGVTARSFLQAVACTLVTYPTELLLRTVQVRSDQYPVKNLPQTLAFAGRCVLNPSLIGKESAYVLVLKELIRTNGVRGLGLGMSAKMLGNFMLLSNANHLSSVSAWIKRKTGFGGGGEQKK